MSYSRATNADYRCDGPHERLHFMTFAPAYHVLAKPTGPICNLDCEYCFFLSKEMLYPGDRFRMADELLETPRCRGRGRGAA
jgi:sulfatase maturation enzyme AslB (radical SAM superfamily)